MTRSLETLTKDILAAARAAGAESADAVAAHGSSINIDVRGGVLEQAERAEGIDLGLRVMIGQRQASVSSSDTRPETLTILAERAVAMAREAPEDPYIGLADPDQLASGWDVGALELCDPAPEPAPRTLEDMARRAEAAALAVKGVAQVQTSSAAYESSQMHFATSAGFSGGYARTQTHLGCVAIGGTGTGMERDHDGDARVFAADLRDPAEIGTVAGQRTVERLGARKPPTGAFPVLFDERISTSLIGHLLAACNGASVARGASWLRDCLGDQVLPAGLSLLEDPHRPRIHSSRQFDGEGLPTAPRVIVADGILQGWTLDLASARKLGMQSSANARRGISSPPSPGNWAVSLTQGTQSREDLIGAMGTGLLVTSMIGSTINPNTGDYSRGASGFWVENGQIAYPVNECTIAGSLPDFLLRMTPANDARTYLTNVVPSLLVEGLTLAGG